jgi:hypothetical protein
MKSGLIQGRNIIDIVNSNELRFAPGTTLSHFDGYGNDKRMSEELRTYGYASFRPKTSSRET